MKLLSIGLVILMGAASCQAGSRAMRTEVDALARGMEQALRSGDLAAVAAYYADDAVLLGPGGFRVEGRQAIDAYWAAFEHPIDWRLETRRIEGDPDLIAWRGVSYLRHGAPEQLSVVEFVLLWERQEDGRLQVVLDAYW